MHKMFKGSCKALHWSLGLSRCSLQHNTLIYGWILPMSLIIAHNLIVFAMVLFKVLLKRDAAAAANSKGKKFCRPSIHVYIVLDNRLNGALNLHNCT